MYVNNIEYLPGLVTNPVARGNSVDAIKMAIELLDEDVDKLKQLMKLQEGRENIRQAIGIIEIMRTNLYDEIRHLEREAV